MIHEELSGKIIGAAIDVLTISRRWSVPRDHRTWARAATESEERA